MSASTCGKVLHKEYMLCTVPSSATEIKPAYNLSFKVNGIKDRKILLVVFIWHGRIWTPLLR